MTEKKEFGNRNAACDELSRIEVGKQREHNAVIGILEQSAEGTAGWAQAQE
jgi:hypothetical protein